MSNYRYFLIYKPFGVLSQFTKEEPTHKTLADLGDFPKDIYPVGRLDKDSEGLLILTNDKKFNHQLLDPKFKHSRTYWAQLEGEIDAEALKNLASGVTIKVGKSLYKTLPAVAERLELEPLLPPRVPSIRYRAAIPTSWIALTLKEGKNRQVRKMCSKVGFPVLRLVRSEIMDFKVEGMAIGEVKEFTSFTGLR